MISTILCYECPFNPMQCSRMRLRKDVWTLRLCDSRGAKTKIEKMNIDGPTGCWDVFEVLSIGLRYERKSIAGVNL